MTPEVITIYVRDIIRMVQRGEFAALCERVSELEHEGYLRGMRDAQALVTGAAGTGKPTEHDVAVAIMEAQSEKAPL
jgi:hypothetical protein